jgi:hypothetical protein
MTTLDYAYKRRGLSQQMGVARTESRKQKAYELLRTWREAT